MNKIIINKAYYIKLGRKGGWEKDSIDNGKIRIGWPNQTLLDINNKNWDIIRKQLGEEKKSNKGTATRDLNALKNICCAEKNDVWITFYKSKLWWCKLKDNKVYKDATSKYLLTFDGWKDQDIKSNLLFTHQISGKISTLQGFRGTICRVKALEELKRLICSEASPEYEKISSLKYEMLQYIEKAIKNLHWKDFELLIDLIFREAGWRRLSYSGETMKFVDLELEEPINKEYYQVQIKSKSDKKQFLEYASKFKKGNFRKFYYIVHSPSKTLLDKELRSPNGVELVLPDRLSKMIVESGLIDWLLSKIK